MVNKFMTGVAMESNDYMNRWKVLTSEVQKTINVKELPPFSVLTDLGFAKIENVDPNPMNGTFAAILSCNESGKMGVLTRVEVNQEYMMVRITCRSTNEAVVQSIQELLTKQLE
jgi:hypothetical protein